MAHRLNEEAGNLDVPFQFNSIVTKLENLDIESFRVKTGEAMFSSRYRNPEQIGMENHP